MSDHQPRSTEGDELEALWRLGAAASRSSQLSAPLLAKTLALIGVKPRLGLIERARSHLDLPYEGDAIDIWDYLRERDELDQLQGEGQR